jgi:hypothetical protein
MNSLAETMFTLLQSFNNEDSQRFTATLWSLWKHRNIKLWQGTDETVAQVVDRAFHLIEDWSSANFVTNDTSPTRAPPHGGTRIHHGSASSTTTWQRPRPGRMKCNIDASFSESLNRTGIGICVRDAEGTFVLAKTLHFSPKCSVPLGEAMGLFFAIQWLRDLRMDHIDFALDSKIVTATYV